MSDEKKIDIAAIEALSDPRVESMRQDLEGGTAQVSWTAPFAATGKISPPTTPPGAPNQPR